jgi:CheY-like chemotaxis protein
MFAYTDGIVEATNDSGEMFGSGRLERVFEDYAADQWFEKIIEQINQFQSRQYQRDDITLIEIAYLPELYQTGESEMVELDEYKLISVGTAARMLNVTEKVLHSWITDGVINATRKFDDRIVLRSKDIYEVLQKRRENAQALENRELVVVLVEDDAALLELYSGWFEEIATNVKLITASNGYEGLLRVGQFLPDIVITDLMMPKMDGFELIRTLRNNEHHQQCKIIAVSALTPEQIEVKGGLADDIIVLTKPFTFKQLQEVIGE